MSKNSLLICAYDFVNSNTNSSKKLIGVVRPRITEIEPLRILYDVQRNRYFQPAENYRDIFHYSKKASEEFLSQRKEPFTQLDIDEYMDNFLESTLKYPTTEFKVMRSREGEIIGGFSSSVNGDELYVSSYYLDNKHKKKGVIRELFEDIKQRATQNGCRTITADVVGEAELKRSQRMGFSEKKKTFWETLLEWKVLDRYLMKNKEVTCPVETFGKHWID